MAGMLVKDDFCLTDFEKAWLLNSLGGRLEALGEYLHDHSDEVDLSFFDRFYVQFRELCDMSEAEFDLPA